MTGHKTPDELADEGDTLRAAAIADEWEVEEGWRQLWYFVRWGQGGSDWMQAPDKATAEVIVWWHNHWPELAAMLRRLTAAEAIVAALDAKRAADRAAEELWAKAPGWPYLFLERPQPVLDAKQAADAALDEALALRERPS